MKITEAQGKHLFVAETDEENNAIAALISLLSNSNCTVTDEEANDHGCGLNDGEPRNFVYIPTVTQLEADDIPGFEGTKEALQDLGI